MLTPTSKGAGIGLADLKLAAAGFWTSSANIFMPRTRFSAVLLQGLPQQLGVGGEEIGGRKRARDLLDVEARLVAGMRCRGRRPSRLWSRPSVSRSDRPRLMKPKVGWFVQSGSLKRASRLSGSTTGATSSPPARFSEAVHRLMKSPTREACASMILAGSFTQRSATRPSVLIHVARLVGLAGLGHAALDRFQIGSRDLAVLLDQSTHAFCAN